MTRHYSVLDPDHGNMARLLREKCATCVFHPGNRMHLRPGRLKDLIEGNTGPQAHGLVCHETFENKPAWCRGFYDAFGTQANFIRIMMRMNAIIEVDPPGASNE